MASKRKKIDFYELGARWYLSQVLKVSKNGAQ